MKVPGGCCAGGYGRCAKKCQVALVRAVMANVLIGMFKYQKIPIHTDLQRPPGRRHRRRGVSDDYGARRVWHDLIAEGVSCGLHRIERLMRQQGLKARPRRRRLPPDLGERQAGAIASNMLDRSFEAPAPNRKWIADFTYIWSAEGWLYVAAVVDLFSRRVVGWSMSATITAQLVTDALVMAIWRRGKPRSLLHHSDRGAQYTSEQFQRLMADHSVTCSMSRSGNCWDNAAMESFFSSLKTERTARKTYRTRDDAKADVFDYIECFYNPKRRHSTTHRDQQRGIANVEGLYLFDHTEKYPRVLPQAPNLSLAYHR